MTLEDIQQKLRADGYYRVNIRNDMRGSRRVFIGWKEKQRYINGELKTVGSRMYKVQKGTTKRTLFAYKYKGHGADIVLNEDEVDTFNFEK